MNEDDLVTGQRYRISAEVELVSGRSVARVKFEDGAMSYVHTSGFKWEKLLPAEPGLGSVVIDVDGDAWQRHPNGAFDWQMAGADGEDDINHSRTWAALNERYGPVKVVYTP